MMTTLMRMTITNFISGELTSPTIFSQRTWVLQINCPLCPSHVFRLCSLRCLRGDKVTAILNTKYRHDYWLNPRNKFLLVKLRVPHLVKKFPALYVNRKFIAANKTACHLSIQSQVNPVHAFPSYFSKINFNIILPSIPKPSAYLMCIILNVFSGNVQNF
jgi:hypothetical protein